MTKPSSQNSTPGGPEYYPSHSPPTDPNGRGSGDIDYTGPGDDNPTGPGDSPSPQESGSHA